MNETDTNPPAEVSDEAVEDRLAGLFADEPESEETDEGTPEPEEDGDAEASEETAKTEDEAEEVEYEGKAYKVPKELKEAILRQSDYTKKTQEVASLRRQTEDKAMFVAAKEQFLSVASEEIAELKSLERELERFKGVDWQQVATADPAQAVALSQRQNQLKEAVNDLRGKLGQKAQHMQAAMQQHVDKQWAIAVEGARQRIGKYTPEEDKAALQQAVELGFAPEELKHKLADERLLVALFKAARWDRLQKSKPDVAKKAQDARPMKVASRSAPQAQSDSRAIQHREALRKTGSEDHAQALLERMFAKRK